jgi:hypothetical protein
VSPGGILGAMSEENVQLLDRENAQMVRKPLRVRERSSRTFDQRFFLRFPRVNAAFARLISGLPPRSRIRQAVAWRTAQRGVEAVNRHDLNAGMLSYDPAASFARRASGSKRG